MTGLSKIILLAGLLGSINLSSCGTESPVQSNSSAASASTRSTDGLVLSLSIDSNIYKQGQEITITVDETNTLTRSSRINNADKRPLRV